MSPGVLLPAALAALCALTCAVALAAGWRRSAAPGLARSADALGLACTALALATWLARWLEAGHLPLFGTYESALSLTAAVLLWTAVARRRLAREASLWSLPAAVAALLLVHGLGYDRSIFALTISERSWAVDVHAVMAWAAFAALAVNAGLAAVVLARRGESDGGAASALPLSLSVGFFLHSAMMASGSFYKFLLFGSAWSFDPVETLGFAAWIAYGTLLHLHLLAGWQGRRLARWCVGLFLLLTVSYRGIAYFPAWSTYHIFDMDLRIHVTPQGEPSS